MTEALWSVSLIVIGAFFAIGSRWHAAVGVRQQEWLMSTLLRRPVRMGRLAIVAFTVGFAVGGVAFIAIGLLSLIGVIGFDA